METMRILALDPSTDITGVVLADCVMPVGRSSTHAPGGNRPNGWQGDIVVTDFTEICAKSREENSLMARIERIAETRRGLETWIRAVLPIGADYLVAYEYHLMRGGPASEALSMAAGAYLTLFEGREIIPVLPIEAKAAWGGTRYKRAEAKAAVVTWANRFHALKLSPGQDGIADAAAVAEAAWGKWKKGRLFAQGCLFGGKKR